MMWKKASRIYMPGGEFNWINSHAQVPAVLPLEEKGIIRVYFATRPQPGKTLTTFVDVDINDFSKIIGVNSKPLLELGRPGTFDEHGIMPSSVIAKNGRVYLFYSGWQRSVGVPYNNYTGLAISEDGGLTFKKISEAPILDRNSLELFSATSPTVLIDDDGLWKMWYCSGTNWIEVGEKKEHTYDIKYAYSEDGLKWIQTGDVAIMQENDMEAITKPTVIKMDGIYHMWYCYRGTIDFRGGINSYRIGYANSTDGMTWERRDDEAGITLSETGWDSEMIAYPEVKKINNGYHLFYNGNGFGVEGFGSAKLIL